MRKREREIRVVCTHLLLFFFLPVFSSSLSRHEWPILSLPVVQWLGTFCPEAQHFLCKPHTLLSNIPCTAGALSSVATRAPCLCLLIGFIGGLRTFTIQVCTWGLCYPSHFSGHTGCMTFWCYLMPVVSTEVL